MVIKFFKTLIIAIYLLVNVITSKLSETEQSDFDLISSGAIKSVKTQLNSSSINHNPNFPLNHRLNSGSSLESFPTVDYPLSKQPKHLRDSRILAANLTEPIETKRKVHYFDANGSKKNEKVYKQSDNIAESNTTEQQIILDQTYRLVGQSGVFEQAENSNDTTPIVIEAFGEAKLILDIYTNVKDLAAPNITKVIELDPTMTPLCIIIDAQFIQTKGNGFTIKNSEVMNDQPWYVKVSRVSSLEVAFDTKIHISSVFSEFFNFKVVMPEKWEDTSNDNRLQFIVHTSLEMQPLDGNEYAGLFINKALPYPTKEHYDVSATGIFESGIVKTVSNKNSVYCIEKSCAFYTTIYSEGIDSYIFFPTINKNGAILSLSDRVNLLEELEPKEEIFYEIQVPKSSNSWTFTLHPTENEIELLMNPDTKPSTSEDYKYILSSKSPKEVVITHDEAIKFNYTMSTFFVKYKSVAENLTSTFKFEIKSFNQDEPIKLTSDTAETGIAYVDDIINYFMNVTSFSLELATISLKLSSVEGQANIYMKECSVQNISQCKILKSDIEKALNPVNITDNKTNQNPIFIFTNTKINELQRFNNINTLETKINCLNGENRTLVNNSYPISESCLFAVGIHNEKSFDNLGTYYELALKMESSHQEISDREIVSIKIDANEERNYVLPIKNSDFFGNLQVKFRAVAISGICSLYFSQSNKFPNEHDNDQFISINDENSSFIRTAVYNTTVLVKQASKDQDAFVYISVRGKEFCVFDLNSEIQGEDISKSKNEIIKYNQLYIRTIEEDSKILQNSNIVYYKIFEIKDTSEIEGIQVVKDIMVTLNSPISGMKLCVQYNTTEFKFDNKCNFESYNDYLQFSNQDFSLSGNETYFIAVQKSVAANSTFTRFPIEFSIIMNTNTNLNEFELIQPGKTFFGHVDPFNSITLFIDLSQMKNTATVFVESEDPLTRVDIYGSSEDLDTTLTILDPYKFGFTIPDADAYRAKYCKKKCAIRGLIYTMGNQVSHFALTYTTDKSPIIIREGNMLTVPNNMPLYFIYNFEKTVDLNFNFVTDGPSSVAFSKLVSKDTFSKNMEITNEINELKFDFKTDIDNSLQIVYPPLMLKKENESVALFFVEPKFNTREMKQGNIINEFEAEDRAKVYVQAEVLKLDPFNPFKDFVLQGEFKYFSIDVVDPQDFSLILSLLSGEADMYVGKGENEFPTLKRFWKKTDSSHGDSIVVDKSSMPNPDAIVGTYVIGVYGKVNTVFSVLWLPDFKNLIKVKFQSIIDTKLEKGKNYFFDFYNKQDEFSSLLYIDDSDVEVSVLDFDKKKDQNLSYMLADEENYSEHFVIHKNQLPREHITADDSLYGKHIVLRMTAKDATAHANILIYNPKLPINGPSNQRFHFVLKESKQAIFLIQLDNAYEDVDVDVKLEFGNIDISASNVASEFNTVIKFEKASQRTFNFDLSKKEQSKDILIFKQLYLRVRASEFSRFSIIVHPKNMFKALKPLQPEIVYSAPDKETYLFFGINKDNLQTIKDFELDLNMVSFFGEKPDMLFLPNDDKELPNQDSKFLPMPLKDIIERNSGEYRQILIRPEIQLGNYILKIGKNPNKLPIKISAVINHHKSIENNGLYKGTIPKDKIESNEYSMYIGQPGEFRLVLESCSSVNIDSATFTDASGDHNITFSDNLQQAYPYFVVDEQTSSVIREFKTITYPIRRGMVNSEGTLNFKVNPLTQNHETFAHTDEYYVLMSEFRPKNKELILKDYIEIFNDNSDVKESFKYEFYDNYRKLKLSAKMPNFKPQLLLDYPDLKKALLKFNFYLFSDSDIKEKIATCGLSAMNQIENVPFSVVKTVDRDSIANWSTSKSMVEAVFIENSLELFKDVSTLNVLCYISVRFFENEDDEWQVSLDLKFANVPYFLLTIPNKYLSNFLLIICAILVFGILFCLALYGLLRCCKSPYSEVLGDIRMRDDISYIAPSMQSEISHFSVEI